MSILQHCPSAPHWAVDWEAIRSEYDGVDALHECPQDAVFHAEGDVGVHTRMACEALAGSELFRGLAEEERQMVFAAVLFHDVAKPSCTQHEGERIISPGHSTRGENIARQILWRERIPFRLRESVCGLIRYHQVPFFLVDRADSQKLAYAVSQVVRCDLLALVAWVDGYGRHCTNEIDQQRMLDQVVLFREYCAEQECLVAPRKFASDHSRFQYFHKENRDPNYHAHDDIQCEVTLMSGLPGAGKDYWIAHHAPEEPVVSLDAIRAEFGIDPADAQGRVVEEGRQRARRFLREHTSFIWNATNLSRSLREQLISLFAAYRARIRIVYVEGAADVVVARNRSRKKPVPDRVMQKLLDRWTVPDVVEAHAVETVCND